MNILVTGGAGYLGSVLLPKLLARGHRVRVLDVGYFGIGHLKTLHPPVELIRDDLRRVLSSAGFGRKLLDGCDRVIHLAAISNDPSAELNPKITDEINYRATRALAELARKRRIRFLLSSSCSVYGTSDNTDERGELHPLTTYAVSKMKAEKALSALSKPGWRPVILRNGTLFGYSPRMRFDLVVNTFSLYSTLFNKIQIFGKGAQWRPFLHVRDCAKAFVYFAEQREVEYECYNIAHQNMRVTDVAEVFARLNPRLKIIRHKTAGKDARNYSVRADRMRKAGFQPQITVAMGAEEMIEAITSGLIPDPESIFYQNSKWIRELMQVGSKSAQEVLQLMETLKKVQDR